jgi:hypothetical protein
MKLDISSLALSQHWPIFFSTPGISKIKLLAFEKSRNCVNVSDVRRGTNECKKGYQPITDLVKGDVLVRSHSISQDFR